MTYRPLARNLEGYTLVEVMIAVAIVAIITAVVVPRMARDSSRNALFVTTQGYHALLQQAQGIAQGSQTITGVCYKYDGTRYYAQIYTPVLNAAGNPTDGDCASSETKTTKFMFSNNTKLCSTAICASNELLNTSVFFAKDGRPLSSGGALSNYQLCVKNLMADSGGATKEIEVTSGGMVEIVPLGQAGSISSMQANSGACL